MRLNSKELLRALVGPEPSKKMSGRRLARYVGVHPSLAYGAPVVVCAEDGDVDRGGTWGAPRRSFHALDVKCYWWEHQVAQGGGGVKGHRVITFPRNDGYAARCEHPGCTVATFGGFETRTAAREAATQQHRADADQGTANERRLAATLAEIPADIDANAYMLGYWRALVEAKGHEHAGQWLLRTLELREAAR